MRFGNVTTRRPGNANPITLGIIFALVGGAIFFLFAWPLPDNNVTPAKHLQAEYPVGKEVVVYYDPELPQSSALRPGTKSGDYLLAGLCAVFFFSGLLALYQGMKAKRRADEAKNASI